MSTRNGTAATSSVSRPYTQAREHGERPSKRPRLANDAHAAIVERQAAEETALEVDVMMLDYLAYQTTAACLASRIPTLDTPVSTAHNLAMTDAFLAIFKARHPSYTFDADLRFRMLLLRFTALFTQRLTRNPPTPFRSALQQLHANNQDRARAWIGSVERIPSAAYDITPFDDPSSFPHTEELERNRAHVLHELNIPAEDEAYEDAFYGTSTCVSLLDILPLFMRVSAARNAIANSNCTVEWMRNAAEFMLQACLEQYLVVGAHGSDAVDEAFAWGHKASAEQEDVDVDMDDQQASSGAVDEVNDMFEDPVYETEVAGWAGIKTQHLALLFPRPTVQSSKDTYSVPSSDEGNTENGNFATDLVSHLGMAAAKQPTAAFETAILGFLDALSQSIARPVLVQLEAGELDGMSEQETADFLHACGLSPAQFSPQNAAESPKSVVE